MLMYRSVYGIKKRRHLTLLISYFLSIEQSIVYYVKMITIKIKTQHWIL